jgi:hypothetical protein
MGDSIYSGAAETVGQRGTRGTERLGAICRLANKSERAPKGAQSSLRTGPPNVDGIRHSDSMKTLIESEIILTLAKDWPQVVDALNRSFLSSMADL